MGVVWTFFSLVYHFSFLTPSLWETARYRLKYCLKGPLSPNQPTNQFKNKHTHTKKPHFLSAATTAGICPKLLGRTGTQRYPAPLPDPTCL